MNCIQNFVEYCVKVTPYAEKLLGIVSVYFDVTYQLLILYSGFVKHLRKKMGIQSCNTSFICRLQ
jgi:hypothetical protein